MLSCWVLLVLWHKSFQMARNAHELKAITGLVLVVGTILGMVKSKEIFFSF